MSARCRILIADDHKLVRRGLQAILESTDDLVVVGSVDGSLVVEAATALAPDVIIVDVRAPVYVEGLRAIRQLRRSLPAARIVVCTLTDDDLDLSKAAFAAGAIGFLSKSACSASDVVDAVRRAAFADNILTFNFSASRNRATWTRPTVTTALNPEAILQD